MPITLILLPLFFFIKNVCTKLIYAAVCVKFQRIFIGNLFFFSFFRQKETSTFSADVKVLLFGWFLFIWFCLFIPAHRFIPIYKQEYRRLGVLTSRNHFCLWCTVNKYAHLSSILLSSFSSQKHIFVTPRVRCVQLH